MSLKKIAEVKQRKRRYYDGGGADPEGTADASRADGTPGAEVQGGFGGPATYSGGDGGLGAALAESLGRPSNPASGMGTTPDINTGGGGSNVKPGESAQAHAAATRTDFTPQQQTDFHQSMVDVLGPQYAETLAGLGVYGKLAEKFGFTGPAGKALAEMVVGNTPYGSSRPGSNTDAREGVEPGRPDRETQPFGSATPAQTTPAAPAAGSTGMRQYTWDPVARQYRLANLGAGDNPMGYTQGQTFQMAAGGPAPSGISAGMPRFVQGGGTGLSDSVPVQMDDGGQGRLADGEFVIPADVVSGLGGGSSQAGSKILYDMMERIRQQAHGKTQQIQPVDPQQALPA